MAACDFYILLPSLSICVPMNTNNIPSQGFGANTLAPYIKWNKP